ncbi:hypothetical protein D3C87_1989220 [compost metagenome]
MAIQTSAICQPKALMKPWPRGAKMNWPAEEAAVAMPKTKLRFSAGTARPNAAMTTPKDATAIPTPVTMPAVRVMARTSEEKAMPRRPSA